MGTKKKSAGKWNFLIMLILCGIFYMTFLDPERIYAAPLDELYTWVRAKVASEPAFTQAENPAENTETGSGQVTPGDSGLESGPDGESGVESLASAGAGENAGAEEGATGENGSLEEGNIAPDTVPDYRDPSEILYTQVEDDYFADALFIGDSRTVGMFEYGGLEEISTFYAETGLTIYKLLETVVSAVDIDGVPRKLTIEEALAERQYSEIYLMVGINELGTGTPETFLEKYAEVIERIHELQPGAILYIQGIMKVTAERSGQGDYINNEAIEVRNEGLAAMVDNVTSYYLDVNPVVCDETGGMEPTYTFDGVHLKAQYIQLWKDFLKEHVVSNTFAAVGTLKDGEEYSNIETEMDDVEDGQWLS
ncbi:MAG: GDSL-type esterase/lipase family protein [Candidatus Gastranaerophilales bacterium]|nr:GDSL-type esterase/lipase family protein [Candidatus Gastranaerophilales bacterium]